MEGRIWQRGSSQNRRGASNNRGMPATTTDPEQDSMLSHV